MSLIIISNSQFKDKFTFPTEIVQFMKDVITDMDIDSFLYHFLHTLVRNSAMITIGILNAILVGIGWFALIRKIEDIEQSEIRILLNLK